METPLVRHITGARNELPEVNAVILANPPAHHSVITDLLLTSDCVGPILCVFRQNNRWLQHPNPFGAAENFLRSRLEFRAEDASEQNHPWMAYLELSRNCNLRCVGCHSPELPRFEDLPADPAEALSNELEQMARQCSILDCCIDGLDPASYGNYRVGDPAKGSC